MPTPDYLVSSDEGIKTPDYVTYDVDTPDYTIVSSDTNPPNKRSPKKYSLRERKRQNSDSAEGPTPKKSMSAVVRPAMSPASIVVPLEHNSEYHADSEDQGK